MGVMPVSRWWAGEHDPFRLLNGVFKGGGARGVAYAGALEATARNRVWFHAVAGASAGAITASLVATGIRPGDLGALTKDGLRSAISLAIHRPSLGSILSTRRLRNWLESSLRKQLRGTEEGDDVTFEEIVVATGISLYVVVMDLATRQPLVLCNELSPELTVSDAVVASCAIPGVLSAGRAIQVTRAGAAVHQMIDGGAWANYPAFVFRDPDFRTWLRQHASRSSCDQNRLRPDDEPRAMLGYVLDDPVPMAPARIQRFLSHGALDPDFGLGPAGTSGKAVSYALSASVGVAGRVLLLAVLVTWSFVTVGALPELARVTDVWGMRHLPLIARSVPLLILGVALLAALVVVGMMFIVLVAGGNILIRTVFPSIFAALSPATTVPPWTGSDPRDLVVMVPASGLKTLSFFASDKKRQLAIDQATHRVEPVIAAWLRGDRIDQQSVGPIENPARGIEGRPRIAPMLFGGLVLAVFLTTGVALLVVGATERTWASILMAAVIFFMGLTGLVFVAGRDAANLAKARARYRPRGAKGSQPWRALVCLLLGAILVAGSTALAGINVGGSGHVLARVTSAQIVNAGYKYHYSFVPLDGSTIAKEDRDFYSDRLLAVDRSVRLEPLSSGQPGERWTPQTESAEIVLFLPPAIIGIVVLLSGVRQSAWYRSNRELTADR